MTLKKFWSYAWRYLALVLGLTALVILARGVLPRPAILDHMSVTDPARAFGSLMFVHGLYALLLQFVAVNARTGGWSLLLALVSLYVGVGSVMIQIETLFFGQAFALLPPQDVLLLILSSAVVGIAFSALVITVTGRWKAGSEALEGLLATIRLQWPALVGSMVLYPVLYFLFGYYVAYGSQATVEFYQGTSAVKGTEALVLFQIFRGALWALCALAVTRVLPRREHALVAVAGGFALFTAMGLIFQNPVMPEAVRYSHGFELTSSMTLYGLILGLWLTRPSQVDTPKG